MTTVINNPGEGDSSGMGIILGIVGALILIGLFFVYVLPTLRNGNEPDTKIINVQLPPTPNPVTN